MCASYIKYRAIPTREVYSGFYYKPITPTTTPKWSTDGPIIDDIRSHGANFTEYELHCFTSKMSRMLRFIDKSILCKLDSKKIGSEVRLYIRLDSGGEFYPITEELEPVVEAMVTKAKEMSNYFLLIEFEEDLIYDGTCLPLTWMRSMISFVEFPPSIIYLYNEVEEVDNVIVGHAVYIRLDPRSSYTELAKMLSKLVLDSLVSMFRAGTVVLSSTVDSQFIIDWDLKRVGRSKVDDEYSTYAPRWKNYLLTKSPSEFLEERANEWIRVDVSTDPRARHRIAGALEGYEFKFCDKHVMVKVTNIIQANRVIKKTATSAAREGEVYYEDVHAGTVRSIL